MYRGMEGVEFGYFNDYRRLRAEVLTGAAPAAVVGFDGRCFSCRLVTCRCVTDAAAEIAALAAAATANNGAGADSSGVEEAPESASVQTEAPAPSTADQETPAPSTPAQPEAPAPSTAEQEAPAPSTSAQTEAPAPSRPKPAGGWAGLFRNSPSAQAAVVVPLTTTSSAASASATPDMPPAAAAASCESAPPERDHELPVIGAQLRRMAQQQQPPVPAPLQPRGLVNPSNYCYVNAILQMLFLCPPFHAFFRTLRQQCRSFRNRGPSCTPGLDCMVELLSYFSPAANPRKLAPGQPFAPHPAYRLVAASGQRTEMRAGREEDAEEFLSHLLNTLHDELARAVAAAGGGASSNGEASTATAAEPCGNGNGTAADAAANQDQHDDDNDDDEWQCVGPKNRAAVTRATAQEATIVAELFGGQLRYQLQGSGRPLTANLQPFFVLPLDIHQAEVATLADALDAMTRPEPVDTNRGRASKTQLLERAPPLLLLQLKRFSCTDSGRVVKLDKRLQFPELLALRKAWLSSQARARAPHLCLQYRLFSIVYHVGHATSGHYVTALLQPGLGRWLLLDDASVAFFPADKADLVAPELPSPSNPEQVRQLHPYLLLYRRADCPGYEAGGQQQQQPC